MNPPVQGWKEIKSKETVYIPSADGNSATYPVVVEVPAWKDPESGEIFLDDRAEEILENTKARYIGLLLPNEIKQLRVNLKMTQEEISDLLQIGKKSWTRWETGKERPSRSMNVLLCALRDRRVDARYLIQLNSSGPVLSYGWWPKQIQDSFVLNYPMTGYRIDDEYKATTLSA